MCEPVDAASDDLENQRAAARRGCSIERAVIMVDRSRRHDPDVRELLDRDERAGVRTFLVDAANALPPEVTGESLRFAIWDGDDGGRSTAIARALREARSDPSELILDEPLARAARRARALAARGCRSVGDGPDCTRYHGLVQYLRLLGVAASPQRHGHFYRAALTPATQPGRRPRVLIAGAADAGMLVHVLAAFEGAGANPEVTVVDRCATPLEICGWYASEHGVSVRTACCDVAEFDDPEPYDAICTESLLTLLPPAVRDAAVARWRDLLRPGGRIVTTARIAGPAADRPAEAPAEAFAERVRREAERRRELLDVDPETLADEARRYHGTIPLHPVASRAELIDLFERAGLRIETFDIVQLDGRDPSSRDAVGSYRSAEYARVVALA